MLPYLILYAASIFLVGLFNALGADSVNSFWTDGEFWSRFLSQNLANALVFTATIMMYLERKDDNEDYSSLKKSVNTTAKTSLEADFGEFVSEENKATKIAAYQEKILHKIAKDEKKAELDDIELWYDKEIEMEDKLKNAYCRDRNAKMNSIKIERLEPIITAIKIDFDRIDKVFVETGNSNNTEHIRKKKDSAFLKLKENSHRLLFSVAGAIVFNAFLYKTNEMDGVFWLRFAQSMFFLAWMFLSAKSYTLDYIARILITDLNTRFNIIKDYLTWKLKKR